ncbi:MAG: hypothetical protein H7138_04155, partial [Myxococcales bacterium]|nr:hypothetical protein [Myxococcales bacterium]
GVGDALDHDLMIVERLAALGQHPGGGDSALGELPRSDFDHASMAHALVVNAG